jgi:hypothetical protein
LPNGWHFNDWKKGSTFKSLFEDLVDFAEENRFQLNYQTIMTDLELDMIRHSKSKFQGMTNKVCLFPLSPMQLTENLGVTGYI